MTLPHEHSLDDRAALLIGHFAINWGAIESHILRGAETPIHRFEEIMGSAERPEPPEIRAEFQKRLTQWRRNLAVPLPEGELRKKIEGIYQRLLALSLMRNDLMHGSIRVTTDDEGCMSLMCWSSRSSDKQQTRKREIYEKLQGRRQRLDSPERRKAAYDEMMGALGDVMAKPISEVQLREAIGELHEIERELAFLRFEVMDALGESAHDWAIKAGLIDRPQAPE